MNIEQLGYQFRKEKNLTKIIFYAFLIRLAVVVLVYLLGDSFGIGFMGFDDYNDDVRITHGALYYSEHANSLFDWQVYRDSLYRLGDWSGGTRNPFKSASLWNWMMYIIIYYTKSDILVRILCVIFECLAIKYIYRFARYPYGEDIAYKAAKLWAILPYPVLFSPFPYKDHLVLFFLWYIMSNAVTYRYTNKIKIGSLIMVIISMTGFMMVRSGFAVLVIIAALAISFSNKISLKIKKLSAKTMRTYFVIGAAALIAAMVLLRSWDTISYKLHTYLSEETQVTGSSMMRFLKMNGIKDIYKIPLAYIFAIVSPIDLFGKITTWFAIVSNANVLMCPISVGATFYIIHKKKDKLVFWAVLCLYLITLVTSINIFRHYYSLLPHAVISFTVFNKECKNQERVVFIIVSAAYILLLGGFYGLRLIR